MCLSSGKYSHSDGICNYSVILPFCYLWITNVDTCLRAHVWKRIYCLYRGNKITAMWCKWSEVSPQRLGGSRSGRYLRCCQWHVICLRLELGVPPFRDHSSKLSARVVTAFTNSVLLTWSDVTVKFARVINNWPYLIAYSCIVYIRFALRLF